MLELRTPAAVIAWLLMLGLVTPPAGAQQSKNLAIVNAVLDHRAHWVGDSTHVDACSVYEALGRPANFPAGINSNLIPLLDRTRDPCAADSARVAVRWPPRYVRMDTLQATGSAGPYVALTIVKGEYRYRERYTIRTWQSGGTVEAGVREVRTYGLLRAHLVPPQRRMPQVSPE